MTNDEELLLGDLRRVLALVDGIDSSAEAAAITAFGWQEIDAELAELVYDSTSDQDGQQVVLRHSAEPVRLLTFSTAEVTIEIELTDRRLTGRVVPVQPASIDLHRSRGGPDVNVGTDEFGMFVIEDLPPGPASLVCRAGDGSWTARTSWVIT